MNNLLSCYPKSAPLPGIRGRVIASLGLALLFLGEAAAQSTFGGNAQHTANYTPKAQSLNAVHWTTAIDLNNTGGYAHYGAPLLTPANTIFVPVKTGATGGFQVNVFNASNGSALYSLSTDYVQPPHNWILPYQPVLATNSVETRLYYPGAGGAVYYINKVDSAGHGAPVQQVFYTSLANYQANASAFNSTVFIDTPITADSSGNVFFGFRVSGTAPAPLNTTQSGYARIDPSGVGTYVLAGTAAGDANIGSDTHNCAPALSNDQSTVYVAVKSSSTESYGYLLGLDATNLTTKFKVFLKDPRNSNANNATILDDSVHAHSPRVFTFSTITIKNNQSRSQPPSQHTRQSSSAYPAERAASLARACSRRPPVARACSRQAMRRNQCIRFDDRDSSPNSSR
jgi:hypothetical protein